MDFEDTVRMTAEWYKAFYETSSELISITNTQIDSYSDLARKQGLLWAQ